MTKSKVYVSKIKTSTGVYNRFFKTVKTTSRSETVQSVGLKPYVKITETVFTVKPDLEKTYGMEYKIQKDTKGLYIVGSGKKGIQKTYLTEIYDGRKKYVNIFDKSKLK